MVFDAQGLCKLGDSTKAWSIRPFWRIRTSVTVYGKTAAKSISPPCHHWSTFAYPPAGPVSGHRQTICTTGRSTPSCFSGGTNQSGSYPWYSLTSKLLCCSQLSGEDTPLGQYYPGGWASSRRCSGEISSRTGGNFSSETKTIDQRVNIRPSPRGRFNDHRQSC